MSWFTNNPKVLTGDVRVDALLTQHAYSSHDELERWNEADPLGTPVTLTYSFMTEVPAQYAANGDQVYDFRVFTDEMRQAVRRTAAIYSQHAGITLVEVDDPSQAQVRFGLYSGRAGVPAGIPNDGESLSYYVGDSSPPRPQDKRGDIWINHSEAENLQGGVGQFGSFLILHEMGHMLGLKHPFEGSPTLSSGQDNDVNTVLSYTSGGQGTPTTYGTYDDLALTFLYGGTAQDIGRSRHGTSGGDTMAGTSLTDILHGQGGNDTLTGGADVDHLDGGDGDDVLIGGAGSDRMWGGAGNDTYRFAQADGFDADRISDSGGVDTIEFTDGALADLRIGLWGYLASATVGYANGAGATIIGHFAGGDNAVERVRVGGVDYDLISSLDQVIVDGAYQTFTASEALRRTGTNHAPVVANATRTGAAGAWIKLSTLLSVSDADGDAARLYRVGGGDSSGAGPKIWTADDGYVSSLTINAARVGNVWLRVGDTPGAASTITVAAHDGWAWSADGAVSLTTINNKPVVTASDREADAGQWLTLRDLVSATDADGQAVTQWQFYDEGTGADSGYLFAGGSARPAGQAVTVDAADLGRAWLRGGGRKGSETIWARASDGYEWSDWRTFTLTTRNQLPQLTMRNQVIRTEQWQSIAGVLSAVDGDGDAITRYRFWGGGTGASSARLWVAGEGYKAAGASVELAADRLSALWLQAGTAKGSETLWISAHDGTGWSDWSAVTVTSLNRGPGITVGASRVGCGRWKQLSTLVSAADPEGDAVAGYQIWDAGTWTNSGALWSAGAGYYAEGRAHTVSAADFANVWLKGAGVGGRETIWVRASDGEDWGAWTGFKLITENQRPVVTAGNRTGAAGSVTALSTMVSYSDGDNHAAVRYQVWDDTAGATSGRFEVGGVAQDAGRAIEVAADQLSSLAWRAGSAAGTDRLYARAHDGTQWSTWAVWDYTTLA